MGSNCLETPLVIGYKRVPEPPASTIPLVLCSVEFLMFNFELVILKNLCIPRYSFFYTFFYGKGWLVAQQGFRFAYIRLRVAYIAFSKVSISGCLFVVYAVIF